MKIELNKIKIREVFKGYKDSDEEGVIAYGGKLDIRPKYQREFVYKPEQRNQVIKTILRGYPDSDAYFPLNTMYWLKTDKDTFEVIDGQQRTLSICQYINGDFSIDEKYFHSLNKTEQEYILEYPLQVYICTGSDKERLEWFEIINTAGEILTPQELRNANYTGEWLTDAKRWFSKNGAPAYRIGEHYVKGSPIRQEFLETALNWISARDYGEERPAEYMSKHQHNTNANELWEYFQSVIEWVHNTFTVYYPEMKGLNWGQLHDKYHKQTYNSKKVSEQVQKLYGDPFVKNSKGIFEYVLGGSSDTKLLDVRVFDDPVKRSVYASQTKTAKTKSKSNCPDCAMGHDANKSKIWDLNEMEADHVSAWSKSGSTDAKNCEMLCVRHNRAKGNR